MSNEGMFEVSRVFGETGSDDLVKGTRLILNFSKEPRFIEKEFDLEMEPLFPPVNATVAVLLLYWMTTPSTSPEAVGNEILEPTQTPSVIGIFTTSSLRMSETLFPGETSIDVSTSNEGSPRREERGRICTFLEKLKFDLDRKET
jgi:hypothetical protein